MYSEVQVKKIAADLTNISNTEKIRWIQFVVIGYIVFTGSNYLKVGTLRPFILKNIVGFLFIQPKIPQLNMNSLRIEVLQNSIAQSGNSKCFGGDMNIKTEFLGSVRRNRTDARNCYPF